QAPLAPTPAATQAPDDADHYSYSVSPGNSLWKVAMACGSTPDAVAAASGISLNTPLQVGQTLIVPPPDIVVHSATEHTISHVPSAVFVDDASAYAGSPQLLAGYQIFNPLLDDPVRIHNLFMALGVVEPNENPTRLLVGPNTINALVNALTAQ